MKINKNYFVFIIVILLIGLSIITGCQGRDLEKTSNKAIENQVNSETEDDKESQTEKEKTDVEKETTEDIEHIIVDILEEQKNAILKKDRYGYLSTLNFNDKLLQYDKNGWAYYLTKGDIKDFTLELVDILSREEDKVIATIHLKYTVDENSYDLTYPVKFEKINNKWYHSGPDYREMNNGNIRLLYFEEDEEYAEIVMEAAVESYKTVLDNFNLEDWNKIVIKFYSNDDWLRQFVKPTNKSEFLAFAEGSGNISLTYSEYARNDEELKYSFKSTLIHEITHEVSFAIANYKPFPQWVFEGIAEYYAGSPLSIREFEELRMWTIEELDAVDFWEMTDRAERRSFYVTSAKIIGYLADRYREEKVIELLKTIGQSSLSNEKLKERFIEAFEKTYSIKYDEFKKEWTKFIEKQ
jgi:hypothetical protein